MDRHKCRDDIKMYLQYVGWEGLDSTDLSQDREHVAGCYVSVNESSVSIKFGKF